MGMVQSEKNNWLYDVTLFLTDETYTFSEAHLLQTGKKMRREDFYTGESLHIKVNPKTGEGKIMDGD